MAHQSRLELHRPHSHAYTNFTMARPNIVLTFADDQRHSMLSCCDGPTADAVNTPNLDALAARGCRFSHAYHPGAPTGAVCVPSRAMLHTGRGPFNLPPDMAPHGEGAGYNGKPNAPTLGQLLGKSGYRTHFVGKWHNGEDSLKRSFDDTGKVLLGGMCDPYNVPVSHWNGQTMLGPGPGRSNVHATEMFSEDARAFVQRYGRGEETSKPFFLCVAFTAPHDPRKTHQQFHERYNSDNINLPPNFRDAHPFDNGHMNNRDENLIPHPRDKKQVQREIADYYAMTEHMDHGIGRIHQALEEAGLSENTLVIHSGDHGLSVGQHGLMGKQNLYDHSTRVPLIMAGPGVSKGQRRNGLCYQHDLFPTLLETAQCAAPDDTPFQSLWPMINQQRASNYDYIGCYFRGIQRMITDGHSKLIQYHVRGNTFEQTFDLDTDPWETIDKNGKPLHPSDKINIANLEKWQRKMDDPILMNNG